MSKFKAGNIITLKDNPDDEAVKNKEKGMYRITTVYPNGYAIYSYNLGDYRSLKSLQRQLELAQADWYNIVKDGLQDQYPCHLGQHSSVKHWLESAFRLATAAEKILYAD